MNLYLLRRKTRVRYDELDTVLIRAESEELARSTAAQNCGGEGRDEWMSTERSSCELLTADGPAGIICADFYEA